MMKRVMIATLASALALAGFALAQGPNRREPPQPPNEARIQAAVERQSMQRLQHRVVEATGEPSETLTRTQAQRHEARATAQQIARHERAMLQRAECDDPQGEPEARATRQMRGPQANW